VEIAPDFMESACNGGQSWFHGEVEANPAEAKSGQSRIHR
jgi:hypothetical protein